VIGTEGGSVMLVDGMEDGERMVAAGMAADGTAELLPKMQGGAAAPAHFVAREPQHRNLALDWDAALSRNQSGVLLIKKEKSSAEHMIRRRSRQMSALNGPGNAVKNPAAGCATRRFTQTGLLMHIGCPILNPCPNARLPI
jgi:hypothetical protein